MSDAGISGLTPDGRDLDGGVGRAADAERAYRIIKGVNAQCGTTVTYRSREPFVISAVTLVLFAGWMVGLVVTAAQAGKAAQGVAIVVLGSVPVLWLLVRSMMAAVITDADGVVVRNIMRSLRIDWTEIRDVTIGSMGILSRVALVKLDDGRVIAAWGIQGPNPMTRPKNRSAERLVEQLNAELTARQNRPGELGHSISRRG